MARFDRLIERANRSVIERPRRVLLVFLVLTVVFSFGLGNVQTEAGTQQFSESIPAEDALQDINRDFNPSFSVDTGSTQLIQTGENVLSKRGLLRMLEAQKRLQNADGLRVESTSSAAQLVALQLDPEATTLEAQIRAIEHASDGEVRRAVRRADDASPAFSGLVSNDYNPNEPYASATIGVVTHEVPAGLSTGSGQGGSSPLTAIQVRADHIVGTVDGDIRVFGSGIIAEEFGSVITDSLIIVIPAAVVFIVFFLIIAYRDLADLLLGMVALFMTIVWTFGFMGLAGIPFSQMLIAVPPLLLAVGIDFGIHVVNRYREERVQGAGIDEAIRVTNTQLAVAFFIVTGTTVIGFLSNLTSSLVPIRDFGVVASIGIVFTFLIFGVFVPAAKVWLDRARERYPIPTFAESPLGQEGSLLGRALSGGVTVSKVAPVVFLVVVLVAAGSSAIYATGIDTSFSDEDFLPPAEAPAYLDALPEPFAPAEYTVTRDLNFLEDNFEASQSASVTVFVEGPLQRDYALESIRRAGRDPPASFVRDGRYAEATSIVSIVRSQAARDPQFAALVARNDRDGNGIPDDNLDEVYDYLLDSPARAQTLSYLTADRRSTRVVYTVKADASQSEITDDAKLIADDVRFPAVATGSTVVFQAISDLILQSALVSLAVAIVGTVVFLVLIYWLLLGRPSLGVANTVPILVTVAFLAGTMRVAGISFNAFTATILAITIGLGIDYSVHVTHRFADEYMEHGEDRDLFDALERTVRGTGGALAGSMFTTVFGIGVLVLAIFPAIGQFGLLTGLSVVYSFFASLFVLPAVLVVWAKYLDGA
jgi:predicted RND superfamily exporter protein